MEALRISPKTQDQSGVEDIAEMLISTGNFTYHAPDFYIYDDGHWQVLSSDDLRRLILNRLPRNGYNTAKVQTIVEIMRISCTTPEIEQDSDTIYFANGRYDVRTNEFSEYKRDDYALHTFAANYNPGASCPRWLQFLDEIFEPDDDRVEKIELMQEFFGYCLSRSTVYEKCLLALGEGSNGKSVMQEALIAIIGKRNMSSLELWQMSNNFQTGALQNKAVNISSELNPKDKFSEASFKKIVSGELLFADRKYQEPYQFRPFAKLVFSCNDLPMSSDNTYAYWRRWLILEFNRTFGLDDRDVDLKSKLTAEADGIALWSLSGLQRLRDRNRFTEPPSHNDKIKFYQIANNNVSAFADEMLEVVSGESVLFSDLYRHYVSYCNENGYRSKSKLNFKTDLMRAMPGVVFSTSVGQRVFQNIKYLSNDLPY
jgi:putative DNA primase/helicase